MTSYVFYTFSYLVSSLFPVLHDIIDDQEIIGNHDMDENEAFRRQQSRAPTLSYNMRSAFK